MPNKPTYQDLEQRIRDLEQAQCTREGDANPFQASNSHFRLLLDDVPGMICTFLPNGEITFINRAFCQFLKNSFESLIGTSFFSLIPEKERGSIIENIRALTPESPVMSQEHQVVTTKGNILWYQWINRAFFKPNGEVDGYCSIGKDITDRKQVFQSLSEEKRQFQQVLEHFPYGVCVVDEQRRIQFVNEKIRGEFGDPGLTPCHEYFRDMPGLCPACRNENSFREDRSQWEWHSPVNNRDYELFDIPLKNENGSSSRVQVFNDITDRKLAEKALLESEAKYRALVENAGEAIYIAQEGTLKFANKKAEEYTGATQEELLAKDFVRFIHPEDRDFVLQRHIKRQQGKQVPPSYSFRLVHKSGAIRWVELNVTSIEWQSKPATLNFLRDVTERKQMEDALRERERRFSSTLNNMMEGCQIIGYDWQYLYMNQAAARHGRGSKEYLLGKRMMDLYPGIEKTQVFALMQDAMLNRNSHQVDNEFQYMDGSSKWFELSIQPVPEGIFVLSIDISERKIAEESLLESERRFRTLFEQAPIGLGLVTPQGIFLRANLALLEMTGFSEKELCSMPFLEWTYPEDKDASLQLIRTLVQGEASRKTMEKRYIRKDGEVIWGRTAVTAVWGDDSNPEYYIAMIEDITESKRSERILQDSEARYRNLFMHSPDAILVDVNGKVTLANEACLQLFGTEDPGDIVGKSLLSLFHPDFHEVQKNQIQLLSTGATETQPIEVKIVRLDGKNVDVEALAAVFSAGNTNAIHIIIRDISSRKKMEQEKDQLQAQLSQSQKMESIGRLAGGVAHDLNNLLSPIIGFGEILSDDLDPTDPRKEAVDEILGAGLRARNLVRQLLAFSRKQTLEVRPVDIGETISRFENLLRRTIPEDIEIKIASEKGLGLVMADVGQIEQVIMNLAVNAADSMPNGGVLSIETAMVDLDENYADVHANVVPGRYVMLALCDTGCGMDEPTREQIFEPFFSTKGERGTGLGLATVHGIIKQHDGHIWTYSELNKGSTFKIYLPIVDEPARNASYSTKPKSTLAGKETILLVEDNDHVRRLAHAILLRQGYKTLLAKDSQEAISLMESSKEPVQLLLTDVVMPGMNGRELFTNLEKKFPHLKVLYMSGYTDNVIAHRGVLDQGVQFIQKPFSAKGLAEKVREVLE